MDYLFNIEDKTLRNGRCACSNPDECKKLVLLFQDIKDVRGGYSSFPKPLRDADSRSELAQRQQFRFDRCVQLLGVRDEATVTSIDNRERGKNVDDPATTRASAASKNQQKRNINYIANWHYPPAVISKLMWNQPKHSLLNNWYQKSLTEDFVRDDLGGEVGSGYKDVDRWPEAIKPDNGDYPILPTYPMALAQRDLVPSGRIRTGKSSSRKLYQQPKGVKSISPADGAIEANVEGIRVMRPRPTQQLATIQEENTANSRAQQGKRRTSEASGGASKKARAEPESPDANAAVAYLRGSIKSHARKSAEHHAQAEQLAAPATIEKIQYEVVTGRKAGPNRISIQCDRWHKENPFMAKEYFGFETWEEVKEVIDIAFFLKHEEPPISVFHKPTALSRFEQALIGLMLIESNLSQLKIANIFGYKSNKMVSKIATRWIPEWGRIGRYLSVLPFIDEDTIEAMQSSKLVKLGLDKVAYLIDGKDFPSDTVRIDRIVNSAQQSTKIGRSAIRIISWGLACGLTFDHTDGFLGRAGEKNLVRLWASNGRLKIPPGFLGLGDKGFKGTAGYYINMNAVLYPAFLSTGTQFTQQQIGHSLGCSQGRYSIEVFYSRVTNRPYIDGIIKRNQFPYFDDVCHWAHGRANLYRPLQMPHEPESREFFLGKEH